MSDVLIKQQTTRTSSTPLREGRPRVSVIMPFKDSARFIDVSIASVLAQTWAHLELICVDDRSTDESADIVRRFAAADGRIKLIANENRPGVAGALNTGLTHARAEFVARIDSDDIAMQNRIATQVRFMDAHPEVALCGTWVRTIGVDDGNVWRYPVSHEEICVAMLFCCALAHPTVMFRRGEFEKFELRYNEAFQTQDYELWTRAARKIKLANIPEILLQYRIHSANVSRTAQPRLVADARAIHERQLRELGLIPSAEELDLHWRISRTQFEKTLQFKDRAAEWFEKLKAANETAGIFDREQLTRFLTSKLNKIRVVAVTPPILLPLVKKSYRAGRAVFRRAAGRARRLMGSSGTVEL